VGAELVGWLGQVCRGEQMVLAVIDDLQWADGPSARALLFAVRRLQAEQVLVLLSARAGELSRLGEGWPPNCGGRREAGELSRTVQAAAWPAQGRSAATRRLRGKDHEAHRR